EKGARLVWQKSSRTVHHRSERERRRLAGASCQVALRSLREQVARGLPAQARERVTCRIAAQGLRERADADSRLGRGGLLDASDGRGGTAPTLADGSLEETLIA